MTATIDMSLEHQVALMSDEERDELLDGIDMDALAYDWGWNGRPSQRIPIGPDEPGGEFSVALAMAGRGWGKSLAGSQWVRRLDNEWETLNRDASHLRIALLGRTSADVRDVMLEGPSGIMSIYPPSLKDRVVWTPSRRRLELPNGAVCTTFSAEEPSQLRGPQFHAAWCVAEGTMIRTAGGQLPIEMVDVGDRVWTRLGLRPVLAAALTGRKQVMALRTSGGHTLRATGEHQILTGRGWRCVRDVVLGDTVYAWTNQWQGPQRSLSGTASSGTETQRMGITATQAVGHSSISQSGWQPMAESQRGSRSITSITTAATTTSTTLLLARRLTIAPTMRRSASRTTQSGPSKFSPRPGEPGPRSSGRPGNPEPWSADAAVSASSPLECEQSSALQPALLPHVVTNVEPNSGWTRTYDLTVGEASEYFANGLLVHNCDELATYKQVRSIEDDASAWDNLRIAVRLGSRPQILATTTPKRVPVLRQLLAERDKDPNKILLRRGKTTDNRYLSDAYLDVLTSLYGGTALGRQELEGEMLDDVAGAMTSEGIVNRFRLTRMPAGIPWIKLVSVDPSVAERPHDECGIVVIYISRTWPIHRRHAIIVDDLSVKAAPTIWADIAIKAAIAHDATVVAETNQGANLVFQMLRQASDAAKVPMPAMREVWSTKNKAVRAEPVGGAYARGRIHHLNVLPELESQLCLPAGTLIETTRGHIPIESVTPADHVLTRKGFAPVAWAGETTQKSLLSVVTHDGGCVVSTAWHRIWTTNRGFVPAHLVLPTDLLLARPSPTNTVPRLHGEAIGMPALAMATTAGGGPKGEICSIGPFGKHTKVPFPPGGRSIIPTFAGGITSSKTSQQCRSGTICDCIEAPSMPAGSLCGPPRRSPLHGEMNGLAVSRVHSTVLVAGSSLNQSLPGLSTAPRPVDARLTTFLSSLQFLRAASVGNSSPLGTVARLRALSPAEARSGTESGDRVKVYDIRVADGYLPEFYANGILVHNTSYVFGESGYSPDRQDALVQGCAIGLFPEAGISGMPGSTVIRKASNKQINLGASASSALVPYSRQASHLSRYLHTPS